MDTQKVLGLILDHARGLVTCKNRRIKALGSNKKGELIAIMGNFRKDLSAQQREELERIIGDHNSMFVEELRIGEPIPGAEHVIELSMDQPIAIPVRKYSPTESSLIKHAV